MHFYAPCSRAGLGLLDVLLRSLLHRLRACLASSYTILYYTILYYTILYCTILYCTILYCTILYYTMLYYTILYHTILYHAYYNIPHTLTYAYINMELLLYECTNILICSFMLPCSAQAHHHPYSPYYTPLWNIFGAVLAWIYRLGSETSISQNWLKG